MADQNWMDALRQDPDLMPDSDEVDALIKSTREELAHADALMGEQAHTPVDPDIPERPTVQRTQPVEAPQNFQPRIPDIYADLTLEEEEEEPEPRPKKRLSGGWRVLIYVVSVLAVSVLLALVGWQCADDVLALTKPDQQVTITVATGDSIEQISKNLKSNGMIEYPWLFRFYCWFAHAENKIDPGTYELNSRYDYHALVNGMAGTSNRATDQVTIPEGYACDQIFALLEEKGVCTQEELYTAAANTKFDYDFLQGLDYGDENRLEGYLFPDTYEFYVSEDVKAVAGESAEKVLNKFLKNFQKKFSEGMRTDIEELNLWLREKMTAEGFSEQEIASAMMDEHKVIIVASLIEKETASASESANISSVIYNRLCSKQYPLLEIDATVLYALGEHKETLTTADLMVDSPYNTRKYPGLPIGPIANPGLESIEAALHPTDTNYYFYALDRDGRHHFSVTYQEHQQFLNQLETNQDE